MPKEFALGPYFKYMVADVTHYPDLVSPIQDSGTPLYLGIGPECPPVGSRFEKEVGRGRRVLLVKDVLPPEHDLNPFDVPLVVALRD